MKIHQGYISGATVKVYDSYPLVPMIPGTRATDHSISRGDKFWGPKSQVERDELALSGHVYLVPYDRPETPYRETPIHPSRINGKLIRFQDPGAVKTALREFGVNNYRDWYGRDLITAVQRLLKESHADVDITNSAATSDLFAEIVARDLGTFVETTSNPVNDVVTRSELHKRSPWRAQDLLMLSAHLAWYWNRAGNYDLEVRYIAMMGYSVFSGRSDAGLAAMSMLGNIDTLYDRMEAQGDPVDGDIRGIHDSLLETVHEEINRWSHDEEEPPPMRESDRFRPPPGSRARVLIPPRDGASSMLNLTDDEGMIY